MSSANTDYKVNEESLGEKTKEGHKTELRFQMHFLKCLIATTATSHTCNRMDIRTHLESSKTENVKIPMDMCFMSKFSKVQKQNTQLTFFPCWRIYIYADCTWFPLL